MRDQGKPGTNWKYAKELYEATALNLREIAKKVGNVTYWAVIKRAQTEGWVRSPTAKVTKTMNHSKDGGREPVTSRTEGLLPGPAPLPVATSLDGLPDNPRNNVWVRGTILEALSKGMSQRAAAELAGIAYQSISVWRAEYMEFDRACIVAQQQWHQKRLGNINDAGDRGDWKASAWALERHNATKDDYRPANVATGNQINVVLNINRPEAVAVAGQTIDGTFVEVKDNGDSEGNT